MPTSRILHALLLGAGLAIVAASGAGAADKALYPSGPPNGVGYLRFANLTSHEVTITSAAAKIALPADDEQRVRRYDPVTPGTELTGTVQDGAKTAPIKVSLTPNEFVTIVIADAAGGGITTRTFRETPSDFNASKASLALYNAADNCPDARLVAGDKNTVVATGVAPGASSRRAVNPVAIAMSAGCGENGPLAPVKLEPLAAGERYSIFVFGGAGAQPHVFGLRDETASFRP